MFDFWGFGVLGDVHVVGLILGNEGMGWLMANGGWRMKNEGCVQSRAGFFRMIGNKGNV